MGAKGMEEDIERYGARLLRMLLELMMSCLGWQMVGVAMIASWEELLGMDVPACCEEVEEMPTLASEELVDMAELDVNWGKLVEMAMLASCEEQVEMAMFGELEGTDLLEVAMVASCVELVETLVEQSIMGRETISDGPHLCFGIHFTWK